MEKSHSPAHERAISELSLCGRVHWGSTYCPFSCLELVICMPLPSSDSSLALPPPLWNEDSPSSGFQISHCHSRQWNQQIKVTKAMVLAADPCYLQVPEPLAPWMQMSIVDKLPVIQAGDKCCPMWPPYWVLTQLFITVNQQSRQDDVNSPGYGILYQQPPLRMLHQNMMQRKTEVTKPHTNGVVTLLTLQGGTQ